LSQHDCGSKTSADCKGVLRPFLTIFALISNAPAKHGLEGFLQVEQPGVGIK